MQSSEGLHQIGRQQWRTHHGEQSRVIFVSGGNGDDNNADNAYFIVVPPSWNNSDEAIIHFPTEIPGIFLLFQDKPENRQSGSENSTGDTAGKVHNGAADKPDILKTSLEDSCGGVVPLWAWSGFPPTVIYW